MNEIKDNYRNVFKSDHLSCEDLEAFIEIGKTLIFTIKEVRQERNAKVAGKKGDFNIAYFKENIKPLVINATNCKLLKRFSRSSLVSNWSNLTVELYIEENVKSPSGGTTRGIRIRQIQPKIEVKKPVFTELNFLLAKKAKATKEQILEIYDMSEDIWQKYTNYEQAE